MTQISLPRGASETGANEWNDVYSNDNAITTVVNGQLSNDNLDAAAAIAHSKLANGTSGQLLVANSSGVITATSLGGDVSSVGGTGSVTISNDAISSAKLSDATDAEITAGTKTQSNRAVTSDHIQNGAITSAKIADGTIAADDVAAGAITSAKLASEAVKSGNAAFYTAAAYSADSTSITSSGVTLATLSNVPPGVYLVQGDLQVTTTGNASTIYVSLQTGTLNQTSPYQGTFLGGTNVLGLSGIGISNDPGPDTNTKTGYGLSGVLTVVATTSVRLTASDNAANSERVSSAVTLFGFKS